MYFAQTQFKWTIFRIPGLKGNPYYQDILNWILQILHHYCKKASQKIKKSKFIEQNIVICYCLSLCLLPLVLSLSSSTAECFKFLDTVFRGIAYNSKRHMWSFVPQISGLKITFSKLSLAKYHYLQKTAFTINSVHNFSYLQLWFDKPVESL